MSGLASASGAAAPEASVSTVGAVSSSGMTWRVTAGTSAAPLVGAWAAATAYTAGQVVKHTGRFYRCTTSGTSGTSGPTGLGTGLQDGSAVWKGVGPFTNGLKVANIEDSGGAVAYWDFGDADADTGDPIAAGGGFVTLNVADPSLIYVATGSGTAELSIAGLC